METKMPKAYATMFQCFEFLKRHEGVISLAPNPDDATKTRCAVRAGAEVAAIEYDCASEFSIEEKIMGKVCAILAAKIGEK